MVKKTRPNYITEEQLDYRVATFKYFNEIVLANPTSPYKGSVDYDFFIFNNLELTADFIFELDNFEFSNKSVKLIICGTVSNGSGETLNLKFQDSDDSDVVDVSVEDGVSEDDFMYEFYWINGIDSWIVNTIATVTPAAPE